MKPTARVLLLLAVTIVAISGASVRKHKKPEGVACTSNLDCPAGYCCKISYERYSYPQCERTRAEGDSCRPGGPQVTNGSRYYPDMTEIVLEDVYLALCPCSLGLDCDLGVCRDNGNFNHLNALPSDD